MSLKFLSTAPDRKFNLSCCNNSYFSASWTLRLFKIKSKLFGFDDETLLVLVANDELFLTSLDFIEKNKSNERFWTSLSTLLNSVLDLLPVD